MYKLNRTIDEILQDARQVNIWQYYALPLWSILRYPHKAEKWYLQARLTREDESGNITHKSYYIKEIGNV